MPSSQMSDIFGFNLNTIVAKENKASEQDKGHPCCILSKTVGSILACNQSLLQHHHATHIRLFYSPPKETLDFAILFLFADSRSVIIICCMMVDAGSSYCTIFACCLTVLLFQAVFATLTSLQKTDDKRHQ